jgi:hypothetical protein
MRHQAFIWRAFAGGIVRLSRRSVLANVIVAGGGHLDRVVLDASSTGPGRSAAGENADLELVVGRLADPLSKVFGAAKVVSRLFSQLWRDAI